MPNGNGNGWRWLGRLTAVAAIAGAIAAGAINWDRMQRHIGNTDRHMSATVVEELREVQREQDRQSRILCTLVAEHELRSTDCPETLRR